MEPVVRPDFKARGLRYVFLFAVMAAAIAVWSLATERAPMLAKLRDAGVWTQGDIGDSRCQKSLHFDYSFVVSGGHYSGAGTAPAGCCVDVGRSVCEQFSTGRSIRIVYSADDPGSNFYSDPDIAYQGVLIGSAVCSVLLALMICIATFMLARNNTSAVGRWVRAIGL